MRGIAVGAADFEALDFELAVELHDGVEDSLHDMGVDQVPLGLDNFSNGHLLTG